MRAPPENGLRAHRGLLPLEIRRSRPREGVCPLPLDPSVGVVGYSGDWQGDLVASASVSGLALFRIAGDRIELARILRAAPGQGIAEPRFVGASRVTGWTTSSSGGAFVDCDRASGRCARAMPLPATRGAEGFPAWRRPVYNPSRPQEGEA